MFEQTPSAKRRCVAGAGILAVALSGTAALTATPAVAAVSTPGSHQRTVFSTGTPSPTASDRVQVNGAGGFLTHLSATLYGVTAADAANLDILLVGPNGVSVPLLSDACFGAPLSNADLTFDDAGVAGDCDGGVRAPSNGGAPGIDRWADDNGTTLLPTASRLEAFNGVNPNGEWRLYLSDDQGTTQSAAALDRGFSLSIDSSSSRALIPGNSTSGPSNPYPVKNFVSYRTGVISDVDVDLTGLSHSSIGDLDAIVVSPSGTAVWLASDACGDVDVDNQDWRFDDEAPATLPSPAQGNTTNCGTGEYRPSSFSDADADTFPAPAPGGPYATSLSALDGEDANGVWALYLVDDHAGTGAGFLSGFQLQISTTNAPSVALRPATSPRTPSPSLATNDVTAPGTRFTHSNYARTQRHATFRLVSTESPVTYQCRIDQARWKSCSKKVTVVGLAAGTHRIKVRAIDAAGNVDSTPAKRTWQVDRNARS